MPTSEARVRANQQNSLKSTGPKTAEGKAVSRANGLKHGLTGSGVVMPDEDRNQVDQRHAALQAELAPKSCLGAIMVQQMAALSVRMERAVKQEAKAIANRVRHAAEEFDEARIEAAEQLLEAIADDPRRSVRKLRKSPEGIDLMIRAWEDLWGDLNQSPRPLWTPAHQAKAENLAGYRVDSEPGLKIKTLSDAIRGVAEHDGGAERAKERLLERIEAEIVELENHFETLDFETIALDRAEAGDRALFDPSREAILARRYESEASRKFFQALKQFRQAEAEFAERAETAPTEQTSDALASSWEREPRSRSAEPREPEPAPATPRATSTTAGNGGRGSEVTGKTAATCPIEQS